MKKNQVEISTLFSAMLDIQAIAQTSSFKFDIDCKLDTLARKIKKVIGDTIGNDVDTLATKTKKRHDDAKKAAMLADDPNVEYRKLISLDVELAELIEKEAELFAKKVDFEFQPLLLTIAERKEGYGSIPDDKPRTIEWKTRKYEVSNLLQKFRELIADRWIVIEGTPEADDVKRTDEVATSERPRVDRG